MMNFLFNNKTAPSVSEIVNGGLMCHGFAFIKPGTVELINQLAADYRAYNRQGETVLAVNRLNEIIAICSKEIERLKEDASKEETSEK